LQEASKYCQYTQEYLSLRARQKKLKAVKQGRNWFTTTDWLLEYIGEAKGYKERIAENRKEEKETDGSSESFKFVQPPVNLPVEGLFPASPSMRVLPRQKLGTPELFKVAGAFAIVIVLLGYASVLSRDTLREVSRELEPAQYFTSSVGSAGKSYLNWFEENLFGLTNEIFYAVQSAHKSIVFGIRSLGEQVGQRFTKQSPDTTVSSLPETLPVAGPAEIEPNPTEPSVPIAEKKGLVVVPSSEDNEQVVNQVKQSFSDEVLVTPQDEDSGIITPVFRSRIGEEYLYILVPLKEGNSQ